MIQIHVQQLYTQNTQPVFPKYLIPRRCSRECNEIDLLQCLVHVTRVSYITRMHLLDFLRHFSSNFSTMFNDIFSSVLLVLETTKLQNFPHKTGSILILYQKVKWTLNGKYVSKALHLFPFVNGILVLLPSFPFEWHGLILTIKRLTAIVCNLPRKSALMLVTQLANQKTQQHIEAGHPCQRCLRRRKKEDDRNTQKKGKKGEHSPRPQICIECRFVINDDGPTNNNDETSRQVLYEEDHSVVVKPQISTHWSFRRKRPSCNWPFFHQK